MCQVETRESLEGIFSDGLINCGKNHLKGFDSLYKLNHRSFLEPDKYLVKSERKCPHEGTLACDPHQWYWDVLTN